MLTGDADSGRMTRALLTDGERDAVRGDPDMDDSTTSSHLSRIRGKMERMDEDARLLRQHRPDLYEQLRAAVVEEELSERIERLEQEVGELRDVVNDDAEGAARE